MAELEAPATTGNAPVPDLSRRSDEKTSPEIPTISEPQGESSKDNSVLSKAVNDVLYSDIGVPTLLNRLKQSISSARELAAFLRKRSSLEDSHAKELRRLCRSTLEGLHGRDSRSGTYAGQVEEVLKIHDRIADNEVSFGLNLHQMGADLDQMAYDIDRGRKHWKQAGLAAEERVHEAEKQLDKAQQKYHTLAEDYDHAKTGDKTSGRHFRIPKSADKLEEDLSRKVKIADEDYQTKVQNAQQLRQELSSTLRPQAIQALVQLIKECDAGVSLQLQKFVTFNEKLILGSGLLISPLNDGESPRKSLREIVAQVDNDVDFKTYITSYSSSVPGVRDIKYEQHPTLRSAKTAPQPSPGMPPSAFRDPNATPTQPPPSQFPMGAHGPQAVPPQAQQSVDSLYDRPSNQPYPPAPYHQRPQEQGFISAQAPPQQYQPPPPGPYGPSAGAPAPRPPQPQIPLGGPPPLNTQRPGSRGNAYPPPSRPIFGISLNELFIRDQSPVPLVVYQCIQAVELFGLDNEGIYRVSGNANQVAQLKAKFDHEAHTVDFRNPESFFHDVNIPANLLKLFFRELPDPLLTRAGYVEFLETSKITDDVARRDRLHAAINDLPDPNYATLRALVLHLHRVEQRTAQNRMTATNLAVIFAPTLMGPHNGPVHEASLQHRVIETILNNSLQIFDED